MAQIVGILNVTPDSFSDGGQFLDESAAIAHGLKLHAEGADWIDVGAESTRPGSEPVPGEEQLRRILGVVRELAVSGIKVSVDTSLSIVAEKTIAAGAQMINDVTAFSDPDMGSVCAERGVSVCLMHCQGNPKTMQLNPTYTDVVGEVQDYLVEKARIAEGVGIPKHKIAIDPGIGFGKTVEHNLDLLRNLAQLVKTDYPVYLGVSRKSFIGKLVNQGGSPAAMTEREAPSHAIQAFAQTAGVEYFRVHDVKRAVEVNRVMAALLHRPTLP